MLHNDGSYFSVRAEAERRMARAAADPRAAHAHRALAALHEEAFRERWLGGQRASGELTMRQATIRLVGK
jgi:hypothetical protein